MYVYACTGTCKISPVLFTFGLHLYRVVSLVAELTLGNPDRGEPPPYSGPPSDVLDRQSKRRAHTLRILLQLQPHQLLRLMTLQYTSCSTVKRYKQYIAYELYVNELREFMGQLEKERCLMPERCRCIILEPQ